MPSKTRTSQQSFGAGIIGQELYGRLDQAKYQVGLAECTNFMVLPHGPAANRPGLYFVKETADSSKASRLIPFIFNTEQAYALEFGDQYVRIHTEGGTVLESNQTVTAATAANPVQITITGHGYSTGDEVYIASLPGDFAELNGRYWTVTVVDADNFTLDGADGSAYAAYTSGGTAARVYEVATPYLEADLFELNFVQSADVLTIVHPDYAPRELARAGATSWTLSTITFAPEIDAPTGVGVTAGSGSGSTKYAYVVTAVADNGLEESIASSIGLGASSDISAITQANPGVITTSAAHNLAADDLVYVSDVGGMVELADGYYYVNTAPSTTTLTLKTLDGTVVDTTAYTAYTSGGTVEAAYVSNDLSTAGYFNTISWTAVTGAIRYNVYKQVNGLFGYIGQTDGTSFNDDNIEADLLTTPPENQTPFDGTDKYPGAVTYFEQRRVFGGTNTGPQTIWMTKSGTESNLTRSIPARDDDAITFALASRQLNRVRHMVPMSDLLLMTNAGEWKVTAQNSDAITPTSIWVRPQGYTGIGSLPPIIARDSIIFVQSQGSHFADMAFSNDQQVYKSRDISVMAPDLFDGFTFSDWCYVRAPYPMVWAVRSDGKLLAMTYLPEQEVVAYHLHETDGTFESVTSIPEGGEDVVYAIVNRTVDGGTKRYVEYMHSRRFASIEDAFFADSGLTYSGSATSTITGLHHLEGEEVAVLADGSVHPNVTVSGGAITLNYAAEKVHVGLPYSATLETLPLALQAEGYAQGAIKNIPQVFLRVHESRSIKAGPSASTLREYKERTTEVYGSATQPVSAEIPITLQSSWERDARLVVSTSDPLPLTLLSMAMEVALGV